MVRQSGSLGDQCHVQYIHVDDRDRKAMWDSSCLPITGGMKNSPFQNGVGHSFPNSAYGESYSSDERSVERSTDSTDSACGSKRNSETSSDQSYQQNLNSIDTTQQNTRGPSDFPSSASMASPETCDETGALLCDGDQLHKQPADYIPEIHFLPGLSHDKSRHNSGTDNRLSRKRHASYEGPASPAILDAKKQEQIQLGQFEKVVENSDSSSEGSQDSKDDEGLCGNCMAVFGLIVLLFANLLNYMDRYTIAGVLPDVVKYYDISDSQAGLIQTSFIIFYMLFSPLFGYLGDRFNRKWLMAVGIALWSIITLIGSFVPANYFWLFVLMRGMVGVGEASYSTIAPTIIADMFSKDSRTKALAIFYLAIPVGSGLGYIVGSNVAAALGAWQWALRVTPPLGMICVVLIICVVREPARGASDGAHDLYTSTSLSGWLKDIALLCVNKSFMLSTLGFTCVAFVAGALAFWAPTYIAHAISAQGHVPDLKQVSLIFGVITCVAGLVGVLVGSESARRLRPYFKNADPLVCAFGLIACSPFLYLALVFARYSTTLTWVLIFIGETFLCLNWAIVTDILLYTVAPSVRSTAEAMQILLSHLLGDAGSPYIVGLISDGIKSGRGSMGASTEYMSLQYALYCSAFVCVLGGGFFLATSLYVVQDRANALKACKVIEVKEVVGDGNPADSNHHDGDAYSPSAIAV